MTAKLPIEKLPDWPRLMNADLAAAYMGISAGSLRMGSKVGQYPAPTIREGHVVLWDRRVLDDWADRRSGIPWARSA